MTKVVQKAKRGWLILLPGPPMRFGCVSKTTRRGEVKEAKLPGGIVVDLWMEVVGNRWVSAPKHPTFTLDIPAVMREQPLEGFQTLEEATAFAKKYATRTGAANL